MAKAKIEKDQEAAEAQEAPEKKGGKLGVILAAAALGALLMLAGAGVTFFLLKGQIAELVKQAVPATPAPAEAAAGDTASGDEGGAKEKEESFIGTLFELDPMIVNLEQSKGKRYLKVKMSLELNKESVQEEVKARLPQLRDAILLMLSSKSFKEVSTVEGKLALRDALLTRINGLLTTGFVKRIYFEEFVVQ
ncbi:MAG: flagellar basal body protein FliL [Nitrospirae bacterium]|nr:MAG: flagellar basal body protein FliL [Nitrospirota bacterium]